MAVGLISYTCPDIDRAIVDFEVELDSIVEQIADDIANQFELNECDVKTIENRLNKYKEPLREQFKTYAEEVRETNSDLRDSAYETIDYYKEQAELYE